jgi:CBS domain-containing protein
MGDEPFRLTKEAEMSRARDIMHPGAECVDENESLERAAQLMRDMQVGSLPICGTDNRLAGIITDRDIVLKCVAEGRDPRGMTARDLAQGTPIWTDADADEDEVLRLMEQHKVRRVPVMENRQLVGMISEADLATHLSEEKLAHFVGSIYAAPPSG